MQPNSAFMRSPNSENPLSLSLSHSSSRREKKSKAPLNPHPKKPMIKKESEVYDHIIHITSVITYPRSQGFNSEKWSQRVFI